MQTHMERPEAKFFHYVLPAMASQLLTGFFIIVDGFYIGQSIGDVGLASINLLWPIASLITAIGLGVGTGGSVVMANALGAHDEARALRVRGTTLICLALASAVLTLGLSFGYPYALRALGASGELWQPSVDYLRLVCLFCTAQVFNSGLNPLLRGAGKNVAAMLVMVEGLLLNLFLDWLLIMRFPFGMAGAAAATLIAQAASALTALCCMACGKKLPLRPAQLSFDTAAVKKLLKVGLSPFGLSMSLNFLIMLNNWQCIRYGSASAVATYAILSYVLGSVQPLLSGIGEGMQPLVSYCCGAHDAAARKKLLKKGLALMLATCAALCAAIVLLRGQLPYVFGASPQTAQGSVPSLLCAAAALPFWGVVRLFSSYFYASGRHRESLLLIFGDPLCLSPLFLYLLPVRFGVNGIWAAFPAAQAVLAAVLGALLAWEHFIQEGYTPSVRMRVLLRKFRR